MAFSKFISPVASRFWLSRQLQQLHSNASNRLESTQKAVATTESANYQRAFPVNFHKFRSSSHRLKSLALAVIRIKIEVRWGQESVANI